MAPTLILPSSFDKDIGRFAHRGETRLDKFGYLLTRTALYKLSLINLIDPQDDIHTYVTIDLVGAKDGDNGAVTDAILDMQDDLDDEALVEHLLSSGLLDQTKNIAAGRIALRTYFFTENGQEICAPQVAGVKVERPFQQQGLCSRSYLFLLNWFEHLVCDDDQTVQGAKIWASVLYNICEVRIYNAASGAFEDRLNEFGMGAKGFLPWNKGMLMDLSRWVPNKVQTKVQKFIVLIISRKTSPRIGYLPHG